MQAAERIFDGAFDNVEDDDGDVEMSAPAATKKAGPSRASVRNALLYLIHLS